MTVNSKPWNWKLNTEKIWLEPCPESYYLSHRWKQSGFHHVLDFGCGLGRHSIHFAKEGFRVSAFDLSKEAVQQLETAAVVENLKIEAIVADMMTLPYADSSVDCVLAYNVMSHTTSKGIATVISEIERILRPGGEFYVSLCSKETWSFRESKFPRIDENTVVKVGGVEDGIPHFYVDRDDIFTLFKNFEIEEIRHVDDCYVGGNLQNSKHYFVLGELK